MARLSMKLKLWSVLSRVVTVWEGLRTPGAYRRSVRLTRRHTSGPTLRGSFIFREEGVEGEHAPPTENLASRSCSPASSSQFHEGLRKVPPHMPTNRIYVCAVYVGKTAQWQDLCCLLTIRSDPRRRWARLLASDDSSQITLSSESVINSGR